MIAGLHGEVAAAHQPACPLLLGDRKQHELTPARHEKRRRIDLGQAGAAIAADVQQRDGDVLADWQGGKHVIHGSVH